MGQPPMVRDNGQELRNLIHVHHLITVNRQVPLEEDAQDYTEFSENQIKFLFIINNVHLSPQIM